MIVNVKEIGTGNVLESYFNVTSVDAGVVNHVLIQTEDKNYLIQPSPDRIIEIIKNKD